VRGVLLEMYREAKARTGDAVLAWAEITGDPERSARDKAVEMVAAAHVHTIKAYGPDRIAGFSPIPAMSMVSHGVGSRFFALIGGAMLSFYDWYADLPVASPQVFGDQTDVPESADWWDAGYLIMWGSNIPVTRTPDAHWMTEARYRGQKVIAVSPDYADNVKFADEWLAPAPGTDGALAMAMGHVLLKEFFVDRTTPYFDGYVKKFTDLPFLVRLSARTGDADTVDTAYLPGKFLTAEELGSTAENANFKTVLIDAKTGDPLAPNGSMGFRYGDSGMGLWNLDLAGVNPLLSLYETGGRSIAVDLPRFDSPDGAGESIRRGVPVREVGGHLVTTVFDLLLAQYGVGRPGLPGTWPTGYDDPSSPCTPAWQEEITGVSADKATRVGREFAANAEESQGRSMIIMGPAPITGSNPTPFRAFLTLTILTGSQGRNGGVGRTTWDRRKCGR